MGVVYPHRSKSSLVETKECIHSSMDSKHIKMTFRTITNEVNKNIKIEKYRKTFGINLIIFKCIQK